MTGYTDNFYDRSKGDSVALGQIARGSQVLFQVAGYCGLGALEAATEQRVWGIGVDVDNRSSATHILTSAVKRIDVAVFATIERLAHGALETEALPVSRFGGRRRPRRNQRCGCHPQWSRKLKRLKADIVAGKLTIPVK